MSQRGALGPNEVPKQVDALLILLAPPMPHYRSGVPASVYATIKIFREVQNIDPLQLHSFFIRMIL